MILYTPGQRVKYDNKLWNIEKMTEKDGQTVVHLKRGCYRKEIKY